MPSREDWAAQTIPENHPASQIQQGRHPGIRIGQQRLQTESHIWPKVATREFLPTGQALADDTGSPGKNTQRLKVGRTNAEILQPQPVIVSLQPSEHAFFAVMVGYDDLFDRKIVQQSDGWSQL